MNRENEDLNEIIKIIVSDLDEKFKNLEVIILCMKNVTSSVVHSHYCGPPHQFSQVNRLRNMSFNKQN